MVVYAVVAIDKAYIPLDTSYPIGNYSDINRMLVSGLFSTKKSHLLITGCTHHSKIPQYHPVLEVVLHIGELHLCQ